MDFDQLGPLPIQPSIQSWFQIPYWFTQNDWEALQKWKKILKHL